MNVSYLSSVTHLKEAWCEVPHKLDVLVDKAPGY